MKEIIFFLMMRKSINLFFLFLFFLFFHEGEKMGAVKNSTDEAIILYLIFIILIFLKHFKDFIRSIQYILINITN
jgi:hypothetical protein